MAAKPKVVTEWYKVNAWFKKKPLKVYNKDYFDGAKINFRTSLHYQKSLTYIS
jgi:hypothetical protein